MPDIHTLILGIGNTLLCDEGAGIHALNRLEQRIGDTPGICFIDGGTLSFTLAHYIEDNDNMIVFDAAQLNAAPGTVGVFEGEDMDAFLGAAKRSPHEVGLLDLFDIARITNSLPSNRALIGIQPDTIDWGMQPTAVVEAALAEAVSAASNILHRWGLLDTNQDLRPHEHGNVAESHLTGPLTGGTDASN